MLAADDQHEADNQLHLQSWRLAELFYDPARARWTLERAEQGRVSSDYDQETDEP